MLGTHGARSTNYILQEADLLIVMARVLDDRRLVKLSSSARTQKSFTWISTALSWVNQTTARGDSGDVADVLAQLIPQTGRN